MTALVFVDTNVFVYARDISEPVKQTAAEEWIRELWLEQRGRTSSQVLSEYYVTVTRKLDPGLGRDEAWQDIRALLAWEPQTIDSELLVSAREIERRYGLSWWDSMIVASAQAQTCSVLLSEDLQKGQTFGETTIVNPFETSVSEGRASYAARLSKPRSRHRPRGRPARIRA
jgi:predicted nucleic acid-binding protein